MDGCTYVIDGNIDVTFPTKMYNKDLLPINEFVSLALNITSRTPMSSLSSIANTLNEYILCFQATYVCTEGEDTLYAPNFAFHCTTDFANGAPINMQICKGIDNTAPL